MEYYIFFVTVPNIEEANDIAKILIENRLAACVNIIQNIVSIYRWKGNIERENEMLMVIKTTENNCDMLIEKVRKIHSYSNPECVDLKNEKGSKEYLDWIGKVVD